MSVRPVSLRYVPNTLLKGILTLLGLTLIAMPVASHATPISRVASPSNDDDTDFSTADMHTPTSADGVTTAAKMLARAESPRELRAMRQLGVRLQQPCQEGEAAANDNVNGTVWAVGGCLATVVALGAATFLEPEPSSSALIGKSDGYVAEYTDCYREAGVDKRQKYALYGCLAGGLTYVGVWVVYAAVIASTY